VFDSASVIVLSMFFAGMYSNFSGVVFVCDL